MRLNSPHDVATWVHVSKPGAVNATIQTGQTGALPQLLGAFVRVLDREGLISAYWVRGEDEEGEPWWTWHLVRRKRKALRNTLASLMDDARFDLEEREE